MAKKKQIDIQVTGITPEGVKSITGVFKMVDTYGIPLDTILDVLKSQNMMPDWIDFYDQAIKVGWKSTGVISKLSEVVMDVYGQEFHDGWLARLQEYISIKKLQ
jgi:hypothetical protein